MKVFVYGTLKQGYGNNRLFGDIPREREHEIKGYKLYYAGFPVATPDENSSVMGEVYDIGDNKQVLQNLDRLEGEGRMYHRVVVDEKEDLHMYVGDNDFWDNFQDRRECPKDGNNRYVWQ